MSPSDQTEGKGKMTWVTVKLIVAVLVKTSEEPVTVTTTVPVAAVGLTVRVSELVVVVLLWMNEAVAPLGRPEADKLIVPLKPPCSATVTVLVPCVIVMLFKEVEREKFGDGGAGVVSETLSKVAVAKEDVLRLLTAKPKYTFCAIVTVWIVPICVQFTPFVEPYIVNTLPLRTSFSQFGSVALPTDW